MARRSVRDMQIRDRFDSLSRGELAGLAIVVVALLAGIALWYTRSLPRPIDVATTADSVVQPAPRVRASRRRAASASASPEAALIIDVTGAVVHPGVFEFAPGDRVIDAVERAGGATHRADLSMLNLAAPLTDGQQILVPKEGAAGVAGGPRCADDRGFHRSLDQHQHCRRGDARDPQRCGTRPCGCDPAVSDRARALHLGRSAGRGVRHRPFDAGRPAVAGDGVTARCGAGGRR